ncbi:MAG: hypothetical protein HUJ97_08480 [Bacteroidales bacterium]|nr:hypothetical protein [Bacteroidales bacterium]
MRFFVSITSIIITLIFVTCCSKTNNDNKEIDGEEYTIFGTVYRDSIAANSDMKVFIDKHTGFFEEDLPVLNGKFIYKNNTNDVDEIFLVDHKGQFTKIYATGGAQIEVNIDSLGIPSFVGPDSLNLALLGIYDMIDSIRNNDNLLNTIKNDSIKSYMNRLSERYASSVIPALVVREKMTTINDSIFLRQYLGSLSEKSKPVWLVNSIEQQFDNKGLFLKKSVRLSPLPKFRTETDTTYIDMKETRENSAYLYFWADYDSTSVDSLKMLEPMAKYYGLHQYFSTFKSKDGITRPKRIDIITICLHAKDSASWKGQIKDLPGSHILLQDGFANPTMKSWNVNRLPYNIIIDRFSNIQDSYQWGKKLRDVLEKMPNNFSFQTNGSNSNNRRPSRN